MAEKETDLLYIARTWEYLVSLDDYCPQPRAVRYLHALVMTYLRGQGKGDSLSDVALAAVLELGVGGMVIGNPSFPKLAARFPDSESLRKAVQATTERIAADLGLSHEDLRKYLGWLRAQQLPYEPP
ncbi:MAG: hypothetical protein WC551_08315 [Patescibacteria group bacterium]